MSGTTQNVNVNITASVSQLRQQLQQASVQLAQLRVQLAALSQAPGSGTNQAQAQLKALEQQASATRAQVALLRSQIQLAEAQASSFGVSAGFATRKIQALVDEALANRWNQFNGTLASVIGQFAQINTAATMVVGSLALLASPLLYQAYLWVEAEKAAKAYMGAALQVGTLSASTKSEMQQLTEQFRKGNMWAGTAIEVAEAFGRLPPAAAQFKQQLADIVVAQSQLHPGSDVVKMAEKLVDAWAEGEKGVEKWIKQFHTLKPEQAAILKDLVEAKDTIGTMKFAIETLTEAWGKQGKAIAETKKSVWDYFLAIATMGGIPSLPGSDTNAGMIGPAPTGPMRVNPGMAGPPRDPAAEQRTELVLSLNKALRERAILTSQIAQAEQALADAQARGDQKMVQYSQEALVTLRQTLQRTHTTSEIQNYQATLASLQMQLAAVRDHHGQRVGILRQIAEATRKHEGDSSTATRAAIAAVADAEKSAALQRMAVEVGELEQRRIAVANWHSQEVAIQREKLEVMKRYGKEGTAEYQAIQNQITQTVRAAANQGMEIESTKYRAQIAAATGNYKEQIRLQEELLVKLKGYWGEQTVAYQSALAERNRMLYQQRQEQYQIAASESNAQVVLMRLRNIENLKQLRFDTGSRTKWPSLLELMGGTDQTDQFKNILQQMEHEHEESLQRLAVQKARAVTPPELIQARNAELIENQRYANQVADAHREAAMQTRSAWMGVLQSIQGTMINAVTNMLTTTGGLRNGMMMIFNALVSSVLGAILKIPMAWLNAQIVSLFTTQTVEAAKAAAQKASTISQITSNAAVAGSAAVASTAAIPVVGPGMAPAAGAAAYATALSYLPMAAFAEGAWNIPTTMMGLLHPGETIVPQRFAEGLRSNGGLLGGGGSGDANLVYAPVINSQEPRLERMLDAQGRSMLSWLKDRMRDGSLRSLGATA
jgi:hypothetical protein